NNRPRVAHASRANRFIVSPLPRVGPKPVSGGPVAGGARRTGLSVRLTGSLVQMRPLPSPGDRVLDTATASATNRIGRIALQTRTKGTTRPHGSFARSLRPTEFH